MASAVYRWLARASALVRGRGQPARQVLIGGLILAALTGISLTGIGLAHAQKPGQLPDDVVRNLYKHYLETEPERLELFDYTSPSTLKSYFDPALARLLESDGKRGEPRLNFDPFVDGQDFEIDRVDLASNSVSPKEAVVTAKFLNFDEPKSVNYTMVLTPAGWRIADVQWAGGRDSLRTLLATTPR